MRSVASAAWAPIGVRHGCVKFPTGPSGALGERVRRTRTFFFLNVQFLRTQTYSQVTGIYPTPQMPQGDFSGVNPLSGSALGNFGSVIDPQTFCRFRAIRSPQAGFRRSPQSFIRWDFCQRIRVGSVGKETCSLGFSELFRRWRNGAIRRRPIDRWPRGLC
jgi:hypothetical protein